MIDYRKKYEEETGFKVPKEFDIHHLDSNRENNDIRNLVAIPKKLHHVYHELLCEYLQTIENMNNDKIHIPMSVIDSGCNCFNYAISVLRTYSVYYDEVSRWVIFRDNLLGKIPFVVVSSAYTYPKIQFKIK